jgi:hypothetical protein
MGWGGEPAPLWCGHNSLVTPVWGWLGAIKIFRRVLVRLCRRGGLTQVSGGLLPDLDFSCHGAEPVGAAAWGAAEVQAAPQQEQADWPGVSQRY